MKLIQTKEFNGYYFNDIKKELKAGEFQKFCEWLIADKCIKHNGKLVISRWDYDRFAQNEELPIIE